MKILYIVKGMTVNGITNVMLNYYDRLDKKQYKIDFAVGTDYLEEYREKIERDGRKFWVIPNRDSELVKYIFILAKLIKNEHYDIVHIHGNSTLIFPELYAAWCGGVKVRIAHSHNSFGNHPKLAAIARPLFDLLYTHGMACGQEAGKWMFKDKPFVIVKNGIEVNKYAFDPVVRENVRRRLEIRKDELVIGHVGILNGTKNQKYLISILKQCIEINPLTRLLLVGDGVLRQQYEEYADQLGIRDRVIFSGISDRVEQVMSAMDIFALPSLFEGVPLVAVEAQASGLQCLVSDNVSKEIDISDLVQFISLNRAADWRDGILNYQYHEEERKKRSEQGIQDIIKNGFDRDLCVAEVERQYRDCILNDRK